MEILEEIHLPHPVHYSGCYDSATCYTNAFTLFINDEDVINLGTSITTSTSDVDFVDNNLEFVKLIERHTLRDIKTKSTKSIIKERYCLVDRLDTPNIYAPYMLKTHINHTVMIDYFSENIPICINAINGDIVDIDYLYFYFIHNYTNAYFDDCKKLEHLNLDFFLNGLYLPEIVRYISNQTLVNNFTFHNYNDKALKKRLNIILDQASNMTYPLKRTLKQTPTDALTKKYYDQIFVDKDLRRYVSNNHYLDTNPTPGIDKKIDRSDNPNLTDFAYEEYGYNSNLIDIIFGSPLTEFDIDIIVHTDGISETAINYSHKINFARNRYLDNHRSFSNSVNRLIYQIYITISDTIFLLDNGKTKTINIAKSYDDTVIITSYDKDNQVLLQKVINLAIYGLVSNSFVYN